MSQGCERRVGECSQGSEPGVLRHVHGARAGRRRHPDHEPIQRVEKCRCLDVHGAAGEQEAVEAEPGGVEAEVAMEIEDEGRPVPVDGR